MYVLLYAQSEKGKKNVYTQIDRGTAAVRSVNTFVHYKQQRVCRFFYIRAYVDAVKDER